MTIKDLNDFQSVRDYLSRVGAEPRTMLSAVVKEEGMNGYWRDVAIIKFSKKGDVEAPIGYDPTEQEQEKIRVEFGNYDWPTCVFIPENASDLPSIVTEAEDKNVFYFRDKNKNIIMIQVRQDTKKGKRYFPITLWSDGEYRFLEPEGKLPLYNLDRLGDHTTVMLVEGAKVCRHLQWMMDGKTPEARAARDQHPWADEMTNMAFVGWTSGALSPHRCDWGPINRHGVTRAYICADGDQAGISAIPEVAKNLRCITHAIIFPEDFGPSYDLYDAPPEAHYRKIGDKKFWVGPSMMELSHPATQMTDILPPMPGEKKSRIALRPHARHLWHYVEESKSFCYIERPDIIRDADSLDAMLRPFSDAKKTSDLILESFSGRTTNFDYLPTTTKRRVQSHGRSVINLYTPPTLKPQRGDPKPWLDFMEQLIPDPKERHLVLRWTATLYAMPQTRMIYAILLVSENTGTGKSTFGRILQQLVGVANCSMPSEAVVAGEFNSWLVRRRLVVINECYSGASWKFFTKLKDLISEPMVSMRVMYKDPVDISNWAHFVLFSNSMTALKVDQHDRRIFAPRVTEERWSDDKWKEFHIWLESGGFQIIAQWCKDFGDYVTPGERAPMTERKQEMIDASRSKASVRAEELSGLMNDYAQPVAVADKLVKGWLEAITKERVYESELEIRKIMTKAGVSEFKCLVDDKWKNERLSVDSQMANILLSKSAVDKLQTISDSSERRDYVRSILRRPNELLNFDQ